MVSDGPLAGFLRLGLPPYGVGVVVANPPVSEALVPVRRQEGGSNTRVAMHNLESTTALLRCELLREWLLLDIASVLLMANGQISRTIDELFPAADTPDFVGSVVRCGAVGTGRFTAMALEINPGTHTTRGAADATGPREGGVVAPPPLGRVGRAVPSGDTAPESL